MKNHLNQLCAAVACIFLFNMNIFAQDVIILDQVQSTKDFTTIDLVRMDKNLTTFAQLVSLADMTEQLENAKPHTLLVPTNMAFDEMSINRFAELINPDNREKLTQFISVYFIPSKTMKSDFKDDDVLQTGFDEGIPISVDKTAGDEVSIGGAEIIKADIEASNGIIDIINRVIEPSENELGN